MLPKHALFQLSYTRISVLPTRLERARRCRQEILSLRCLPFHHGSLYRRSETANIRFMFQFTGYLKGIRPTATRLAPYFPSYLARHPLPVWYLSFANERPIPDLAGTTDLHGRDNRIWTDTSFDTWVWIKRGCQFHHIPILPVFSGCQPRAGHFGGRNITILR